MSLIRIKGNQFEILSYKEKGDNSPAVRPYMMRTSFCLLGHYQKGNRNKGRDWLDRIHEQGFDGPRLFGENQDWFYGANPVFFGNPKYTTKVKAFDANGSGNAPSDIRLTNKYYEHVSQLAEDLLSRDMIAEFCCIATVKGWKDPGWTGTGLNKFAQMFAELFPNPKQTPFLHEGINEWNAHSVFVNDKAEISRMGPRWRRASNDPGHHNYPGSTISTSAGGGWTPGYEDLGYTHRSIHPPRGANWMKGSDGIDIGAWCEMIKKLTLGRPLAFNETVHYMTPEQWEEWIPKVEKWSGLSTQHASALMTYLEKVLEAGVSMCVHDMNGMSTDPSLPLSVMEIMLSEKYGSGNPGVPDVPNPGPTFDPFSVKPYRDAVERSYAEVLLRKPDEAGWRSWCDQMHRGASEARVREVMLRSQEFKDRFINGN